MIPAFDKFPPAYDEINAVCGINAVSTVFLMGDDAIVLAAKDSATLDRFIKSELRRVYDPDRFQNVRITKQ